ncbi:putative oxidoreductase [Sesamum angolense]|uniref:Oxidoreductase n=1 Tax=Sesamum angolense TaxID=2727404 RepID=A0AAE1WB37_9LAMI|nr:putative oxidoreductase [Sesamum angolense]
MATPPIKFGILGCADIARKVSRAITLSPNSTLCAVGSRSVEKAAKFARENGFPESAKLAYQMAVLAAQKKKHVLLEKPVALNVGELDAILEACESSGVQIMDATMWMHHPRTAKMREFLSDNSVFGQLKSVLSCFTFAGSKDFLESDIRVKPDLDALGALGDVGWYCIRSILWAADYELPKSVLALRGTVFNSSGVILACSASLHWEDGKTATFHCSFLSNLTMDVTVEQTELCIFTTLLSRSRRGMHRSPHLSNPDSLSL